MSSTFQILFYALRPGFIRTQKPTVWHGINFATILTFDYLLVHFFGWRPLVYLIMSSFFAGSLHPCAAHFIAEHYLMNGPVEGDANAALAQETTSYYGWLNVLCFNVCQIVCMRWSELISRSGTITNITISLQYHGPTYLNSEQSPRSITSHYHPINHGHTLHTSSSQIPAWVCFRGPRGNHTAPKLVKVLGHLVRMTVRLVRSVMGLVRMKRWERG
jgi:hypothetical protein